MKRFISAILLCGLFSFLSQAKDYHVVYVAHDYTTPTNQLSDILEEFYNTATDYDDVVIFYLSNANTPIIINVNTQTDDNKQDFNDRLIGELQNFTSHDVLPGLDAQRIIDVISQNDFQDSTGALLYDKISFDFYVGGTFWQLGFNESLIAALYWSLNIADLDEDVVEFNVLHSSEDNQEEYSSKTPFGPKNLSGINKLLVMPY